MDIDSKSFHSSMTHLSLFFLGSPHDHNSSFLIYFWIPLEYRNSPVPFASAWLFSIAFSPIHLKLHSLPYDFFIILHHNFILTDDADNKEKRDPMSASRRLWQWCRRVCTSHFSIHFLSFCHLPPSPSEPPFLVGSCTRTVLASRHFCTLRAGYLGLSSDICREWLPEEKQIGGIFS